MRITVLASGSRGNATLVEGGGARLLVDAGYSPRTLRRRIKEASGEDAPETLDAVIVTHSHSDHSGYGCAAARSFRAPLIVSEHTASALTFEPDVSPRVIQPGRRLRFGGLAVETLGVPHDAPQMALAFTARRERAVLATDLGSVTEELEELLSGATTVMLESNHDPGLLAAGPYPPFLKARVRSGVGHLSNGQAARVLSDLDAQTRTVVLMHMSEKNNDRRLALASARAALRGRPARLVAARQDAPVVIDTEPATQLAFSFAADPAGGV